LSTSGSTFQIKSPESRVYEATLVLPKAEWFTESDRHACERYLRQQIADTSGVRFDEVELIEAANVYRRYEWVPVKTVGWAKRGGIETVIRWRIGRDQILEDERVHLIEAEYQESFVDVLRGFREQGASWRLVADTIRVPYNTLRRWAKALGLSDGRRSTNTYIPPGLNEKARTLGYRDAEQLVSDLRASGKTRKEIAELLNCNPGSLYRYTNEEAKELVNITPSMVAARRENVKIAHAAYIARHKGK
jgi:hypothetical protein